jgi:putative flippase GtrA
MITYRRLGEITRFLVTGALSASLQVALTIVLTEYLGLHYLVSLALVAAGVIAMGFFLNRSWTFRKRGRTVAPEFGRYVLVNGANVAIGLLSCAFLVRELQVPYAYSIAVVAVAFAPINYLVHRAWTFGLSWLRES